MLTVSDAREEIREPVTGPNSYLLGRKPSTSPLADRLAFGRCECGVVVLTTPELRGQAMQCPSCLQEAEAGARRGRGFVTGRAVERRAGWLIAVMVLLLGALIASSVSRGGERPRAVVEGS